MENPTTQLPESVTLEDGRVITRKNPKVKDLANAEKQGKGKEHLVKYAYLAAKITVDGKMVVLEDILEMTEEDLLKIGTMFTSGEEKE
jgi:hypothetical protein